MDSKEAINKIEVSPTDLSQDTESGITAMPFDPTTSEIKRGESMSNFTRVIKKYNKNYSNA